VLDVLDEIIKRRRSNYGSYSKLNVIGEDNSEWRQGRGENMTWMRSAYEPRLMNNSYLRTLYILMNCDSLFQ